MIPSKFNFIWMLDQGILQNTQKTKKKKKKKKKILGN